MEKAPFQVFTLTNWTKWKLSLWIQVCEWSAYLLNTWNSKSCRCCCCTSANTRMMCYAMDDDRYQK